MKNKTIAELARIITKDWDRISSQAESYLSAMKQLNSIKDTFGEDKGEKIVLGFLLSAVGWKGSLASEIKRELNRRLVGW